MKTIGYRAFHLLALGAVLIVALANCGAKSDGNSQAATDVSLGGNAGSTAGGGSPAGASPVAPRAPAYHRATALSCSSVYSPPDPMGVAGAATGGYNECTKHADCTQGVNGKCAPGGAGRAAYIYSCYYEQCATDADCDQGKVCDCSVASAARCLSIGNCQTDADCGGGNYSYCSPSMSWDCNGYRPIDGYHCHTASDSCMDDTDCTGTDYCNFDVYEARWKCVATNMTCAIG